MTPAPGTADPPAGQSPPRDGEVERALSELDWSHTPVGHPSEWPAELTTVVRTLLRSRFSMWMGWGPELTFFYNDAYARDTLGRKHPWALGRPASEVWSEIWPEIAPRIESVLEQGNATWDERLLLLLERSGAPEETYHTFSYSPLCGAAGEVQGLLCVVSEETQRVIGERRMTTLQTLAASLSTIRTEPEMLAATCRRLADNRFDLPFSLVYLFEAGGEARLAAAAGIAPGHPAAPERFAIAEAPAPWPVPAAGEQLLVEGLDERFGDLPAGEWRTPPQRALVVPLEGQTDEPPVGFIVGALNALRPFDADYGGFVGLLAGQLAAGIARARAYEREQERARALIALDRAKTDFFSNVSHELRTPLTLIEGPIEEALADPTTPLSPAQRQRMEVVRRNATRLRRMVNDILDFSRIERQGMGASPTPIDLAAFTRGLVASFAPAIERAGLELRERFERLPRAALVDTEMWEKIVLNLLSNALKFTLSGFIEVSLRDDPDPAQPCVELVVSDTGVGIPEEALPRLFERFYRVAETGGRSFEGSGIGLALVHELVTLHNGTITVTSRSGAGSRFVVRIPYGEEPVVEVHDVSPSPVVASYLEEALSWQEEVLRDTLASAEAAEGSAPRTAGATVLVVDDNADLRAMLVRLLSPHYRVLTAADGEQALRVVEAELPDLVLTDVMMPRVDGLELLRTLREQPETASLPVILLSARAGEQASIGGLDAGADDYLVKPFSARELVARVRSSLELAAARREAAEALLAERGRLEQTLEQLPVGVIMAEAPSGELLLANAQVQRILGRPTPAKLDLDAGPVNALFHDARQLGAEQHPLFRAILRGETTRDLEVVHPRPDGEEIVLRVNSGPIRDRNGRIFASVSVFEDVTDEARHRRLLAIHRDILARVAQGEPLEETLRLITETIEASLGTDDARASILLVSDDGRRLRLGAAPRLPAAYNAAIDGIPIAEGVGSCGTAAHRREIVVVTDTLTDPLWEEYRALASRHGLRSCWSMPIAAGDGAVVGTFAVYHRRPWEPSASEQQLVALMSQTTAVAIERDRSAAARARQFEQMQQGLRPRSLARVPGLEVASRFHPGTRGLEVGGDFYDVFPLNGTSWGFMIGDVCGHGAEAAAATAVARHTARALALREPDPPAVLAGVDDALHRSDLNRFCTALFGRLTAVGDGFELEFANGGHPPPLLVRGDGSARFVRPHGALLGVLDTLPPFPVVSLRLEPGDALLSYTDGLVERNPRLPTEESLRGAAGSIAAAGAEDFLTRLEARAFDGDAALDDIALLLLRVPARLSRASASGRTGGQSSRRSSNQTTKRSPRCTTPQRPAS